MYAIYSGKIHISIIHLHVLTHVPMQLECISCAFIHTDELNKHNGLGPSARTHAVKNSPRENCKVKGSVWDPAEKGWQTVAVAWWNDYFKLGKLGPEWWTLVTHWPCELVRAYLVWKFWSGSVAMIPQMFLFTDHSNECFLWWLVFWLTIQQANWSLVVLHGDGENLEEMSGHRLNLPEVACQDWGFMRLITRKIYMVLLTKLQMFGCFAGTPFDGHQDTMRILPAIWLWFSKNQLVFILDFHDHPQNLMQNITLPHK